VPPGHGLGKGAGCPGTPSHLARRAPHGRALRRPRSRRTCSLAGGTDRQRVTRSLTLPGCASMQPMAEESAVPLTPGLPETILPSPPAAAAAALEAALQRPEADRRAAVATVAAAHPRFLDAWASLAELGRDDIEAYAYARVGYHRGLDALRGS